MTDQPPERRVPMAYRTRPWTEPRPGPNGGRIVTVKRACNGCGTLLGDVTDHEMDTAIDGDGHLPDVTAECPYCKPVPPPPATWCGSYTPHAPHPAWPHGVQGGEHRCLGDPGSRGPEVDDD